MRETNFFLSVDVGSYSVRAAVFDDKGTRRSLAASPIDVYSYEEGMVEQSSNNIWSSVKKVIRKAVKDSQVNPRSIRAMAYDATCSLVVLGDKDKPLTVSKTKDNEKNIIMWMDHRAIQETERINETESEVLKYVGGKISPEMQIPKILWLKNNMTPTYRKARKFFDLSDFLVYKTCGNDIRSVCTQSCKWTYLAHKKAWDLAFFNEIGLNDIFDSIGKYKTFLAAENSFPMQADIPLKNVDEVGTVMASSKNLRKAIQHRRYSERSEEFSRNDRLGRMIENIAKPAGTIKPELARELGLDRTLVVAVGIIDAHAGGIGLLGKEFESTLAIIGGTSSCHMAVSRKPVFVEGVWGPYYGAMIPFMWLNEGGQSASGSLIDYIVQESSYYPGLLKEAKKSGKSVYEILNDEVARLEKDEENCTEGFHLLGYFHGNRSPRANPYLKGMISGLNLDRDKASLARRYLAAIQSLAYGSRHIIEVMNKSGYNVSKIKMCGGGTKNALFLREHADITGCEIGLSKEPEAVLLGDAMIAATACGVFHSVGKYKTFQTARKLFPTQQRRCDERSEELSCSLKQAMGSMSGVGQVIKPREEFKDFHSRKYRVFHEMYQDQMKYEKMMKAPSEMLV